MFQDIFGAKLDRRHRRGTLTPEQKAMIVAAAAGLVGLISLFNSLGRIFWASMSDKLGRKNTYYTFFMLGILIYCALPTLGHMGLAALFVVAVCVILTMYGGGFATVPAYLADIFGTQMVGAIHGRLLTAWSVAGIVGPLVIAAIREGQLKARRRAKPRLRPHAATSWRDCLFVGLICNALVKPVKESDNMTDEQLAAERSIATRRPYDPASRKPLRAVRSASSEFSRVAGRRYSVPDRVVHRAGRRRPRCSEKAMKQARQAIPIRVEPGESLSPDQRAAVRKATDALRDVHGPAHADPARRSRRAGFHSGWRGLSDRA